MFKWVSTDRFWGPDQTLVIPIKKAAKLLNKGAKVLNKGAKVLNQGAKVLNKGA